jgi:hypothetical protein
VRLDIVTHGVRGLVNWGKAGLYDAYDAYDAWHRMD